MTGEDQELVGACRSRLEEMLTAMIFSNAHRVSKFGRVDDPEEQDRLILNACKDTIDEMSGAIDSFVEELFDGEE